MMHGTISVTSKPGEGSIFTFNVWLELATSDGTFEEEELIENNSNDDTIDCTGMNFLLVEDNEINQEIAQNVLVEFGANIEIANNGKEALDKFISYPEKYDIIFMDIQMPVMDGFEATKQIRASDTKTSKTIPIIAMTAEVFKEDIDRATGIGMNAHVGKPFKLSELVSAIKKALK